jgi:hypothetical protein
MNPKKENKLRRREVEKFRKVENALHKERTLRKFKWEKFFVIITLCYVLTTAVLVCAVVILIFKVLEALGGT